MVPEPEPAALNPILAGRYRLERVLGQGGMGTVYLGEHVITGRKVAVKVLRAELAHDQAFVQRFQQEARASVTIDHPGVVDVLDSGIAEDGSAYLVMEYLRGETLGQRLGRGEPLPLADVVWIGGEALGALAAAHAKGVLHRDLKPDNLFLVAEPQRAVKLVDFGISKLVSAASPNLTQTGMVMGTPTYMAPEQARGVKDLGPAADLYSMGVILYHVLAGRPPFTGESLGEVMAKVLTEPFQPLRELRSDLPPALVQVVESLLERDPSRRPADATAVRRSLESALPQAGLPTAATAVQPAVTTAPPTISARLVRRPVLALAIGLAAGVAVVGAVGVLLHRVTGLAKTGSRAGEVFDQPISGVKYALVPKGTFSPGCDTAADCPEGAAKPAGPFWISQSLISVRELQVCIDARHCRSVAKRQDKERPGQRRCNGEAGRLDHPANCVTWEEAQTYCHWAGDGRLPTALEWEYAASSGGKERPYPWGSAEPSGRRANFCDAKCAAAAADAGVALSGPAPTEDDGFAFSSPVAFYSAGATDWGLSDMAGNVAQWTATEGHTTLANSAGDLLGALRSAAEGETTYEVRGGSFDSKPDALRSSQSSPQGANAWSPGVGFRCLLPMRSKSG